MRKGSFGKDRGGISDREQIAFRKKVRVPLAGGSLDSEGMVKAEKKKQKERNGKNIGNYNHITKKSSPRSRASTYFIRKRWVSEIREKDGRKAEKKKEPPQSPQPPPAPRPRGRPTRAIPGRQE